MEIIKKPKVIDSKINKQKCQPKAQTLISVDKSVVAKNRTN